VTERGWYLMVLAALAANIAALTALSWIYR
jgi:hypothetical protein